MKTYKVEYSPAARNDLKAIYSYIAFRLKEKNTAQTIVNHIRKQTRELHYAPERYALVDREPWISMGMRKLPVRNYIVFYYVQQESGIVMVTVLSTAEEICRKSSNRIDHFCLHSLFYINI